MNLADYLVLATFLISGVVGVLRGFLREAIALVTWVLALIIAWHFSDLVEPYLGGLLAEPAVRPWAARALIILFVLLLGMATGVILGYFVRLSIFSGMDRFLGFIFGFLRGAVVLGVLVILGQLVHLDGERWWKHSLLIPYGEDIANVLRAIVGDEAQRHARDLTAAR